MTRTGAALPIATAVDPAADEGTPAAAVPIADDDGAPATAVPTADELGAPATAVPIAEAPGAPATAVPTVDAEGIPAAAVPTTEEVDGVPTGADAGFVATDADEVPAGADVGLAAAGVPEADVDGVPLVLVAAVVVELMDDTGVLGLATELAGVAVAAGVQASSDNVIMAMAMLRRTGSCLITVWSP